MSAKQDFAMKKKYELAVCLSGQILKMHFLITCNINGFTYEQYILHS